MKNSNLQSYELSKSILYQLDDHIHVSTERKGSSSKTVIEEGFRELPLLVEIERFMESVLKSVQMPYEEITDEQNIVINLKENSLSKFHSRMRQFLSYWRLDQMYELSENVKLFFVTASKFPGLDEALSSPAVLRWRSKVVGINDSYLYFNEFVRALREGANCKEFKSRVRQRARKSHDNTLSANRYVNQLFELYSRLLVVRVDVAYYKDYFGDITPLLVHQHRGKLLNNMGVKGVFKDCVGFIWKLEYGTSKGFHYHFIFFFDGSKRKKDKFIADQIGEYWMNDITEGLGVYHNANRTKYREKATGMIKHSDMTKRSILTETVIPYLTKQEQYLMAKLDGMRTFGKGVIKKDKGNMGRPRKEYLVSV